MATKKIVKTKIEEIKKDIPAECCKNCGRSKLVIFGWGLLLVGGLAHMLPTQMEPLLKIAQFGISVQMLVGVISVLIALNFLLGDE